MSKKPEASAAAASPSPSAGTASAAELIQRFAAEANLSVSAGTLPNFPARKLVRVAKKIAAMHSKKPALYATLRAGKFNVNLLAAIGALGEQLAAALRPAPSDRRTTKLLTPEQKQLVKAAGDRLTAALEAVQPIARALRQLDEVRALGRAADVGTSAESVQDCGKTFTDNAPGLESLLDDAGVDAEARKAIAHDATGLESVLDSKEEKALEKTSTTQSIREKTVAVEIALLFIRGQARGRLSGDPSSRDAVLGYLPRTAERRKKPVEAAEEKDEGEEEEAGKEAAGAGDGKDDPPAGETPTEAAPS